MKIDRNKISSLHYSLVVVLFNRLHRVYAVWCQISDFAFYNKCTFFNRDIGIGKKKDDKKTKAFYDWATTGIPVTLCK